MTIVTFKSLRVGQVFFVGRKRYKKTRVRHAPKRAYIIWNAINLSTGTKALFGDGARVRKPKTAS